MSLFPMNREIRRAARCRCMVCEHCNWRQSLPMYVQRIGDPRPLKTLAEKEKEIAMPGACSSAGEALNRQIEKDKLKAKMLFSCSLKDKSKPEMTRERAEFLALRMSCNAIMSEQEKIMAAYPSNQIIIEMYDGSLIVIDTDAGWIVRGYTDHTAESYLRYNGWDEIDIRGSRSGDKGLEDYLVTSLVLVGAKNIYVIDM